jgi:hypothetical protein
MERKDGDRNTYIYIHTYIQTDTNRQTDRQIDTNRKTDRHTEREIDTPDRQTAADRQARWTGQMDRPDRQMEDVR